MTGPVLEAGYFGLPCHIFTTDTGPDIFYSEIINLNYDTPAIEYDFPSWKVFPFFIMKLLCQI